MLMNLGGPESLGKVEPFLRNLFSDKDIFDVPFQKYVGPVIAKRRTPSVSNDYKEIGGKSRIKEWTNIQGKETSKLLDKISPSTSPHQHFTCFRYTNPLTDEAISDIVKSDVKRIVVFSQYPQYSCTTFGSSLNQLRRCLQERNLEGQFDISVIDNWGKHPSYIRAVSILIHEALEKIPEDRRSKAVILFSAHSIPNRVVDKGDRYPMEVAETVSRVVEKLNVSNPHRLSWQSKVGPLPWLGPQLEIDITYGELARDVGVNMIRCDSLNDHPLFLQAMADIVNDHMMNDLKVSNQLLTRCSGCSFDECQKTRYFFEKQ